MDIRTVFVVALLATSAKAQENPFAAEQERRQTAYLTYEEQVEMFQLYTDCHPIQPVIRAYGENEELGLDMDQIHAAVESRLRAARIYQDSGAPALLITIGVVDDAFLKWFSNYPTVRLI